MKPTVILYSDLPAQLLEKLHQHTTLLKVKDLSPCTVEHHAEAFKRAEGLMGSGCKVTRALLDKMPALRVCSTISAGYDNFDLQALTERKILLTHTPSALTETVADAMMALVLATARHIPAMDHWVKTGGWQHHPQDLPLAMDVHHKTMGIIGMGRIGLALAKRAHHGFGMDILYHSRSQHSDAEQDVKATYCDLDSLLNRSDFVCLVLPLSAETHHFISHQQLSLMKPSAILINAGRGAVVDQTALIGALQSKRIYGAGLDVYEQEPLSADSMLTSLPNVVTLPHIGSATHETRYAMKCDALENLLQGLNGNLQINRVNL